MTRPKVPRPWPVEDLARLVGGRAALTAYIDNGEVSRAYKARGLSDRQADSWAVRCGLDPYVVWPGLLEQSIRAVEVECARPGCGVRFVPARRDQVGCSRPCAVWVRNQRRRARPEVRQADRERMARYYEENGEHVRRERRRRYRASRTQSVDTTPKPR